MGKSSIEPEVEGKFVTDLETHGVHVVDKNKSINDDIQNALDTAVSKQGGSGGNQPDRQFLTEVGTRRIPVMVEAKGTEGRLLKLTKDGQVELVTEWNSDSKEGAKVPHKKGELSNYSTINNYAVNGAVHYARAIISGTKTWKECIAVGINGFDDDTGKRQSEIAIYYVSEDKMSAPIFISDKIELLYPNNWAKLFEMVEDAQLTDAQKEAILRSAEENLEKKVNGIHQSIYENKKLDILSTNEKLYLFCGLIMAGLKTESVAPLDESKFTGNKLDDDNDGTLIMKQIRSFLREKNCSADKIETICTILTPVFVNNKRLWMPTGGESVLKALFRQVSNEIIPCFEGNLHLDFTGKILNSLGDWVHIENDNKHDVVLTPRHVTRLMANLARTNRNSFVWDKAMGSAGFLVSAMDIMIKDAQDHITDKDELKDKIKHIKEQQLLDIEILGNIYILAVLNMILMGDGSSHVLKGDSHDAEFTLANLSKDFEDGFPANVFLLNPPYSAAGKGFNFVEEALSQMTTGYAAILIMDSAGSGQGCPYTQRILQHNTLEASIKMPDKLFEADVNPQTYIFVFKIGRPHEEDDMVTFIDFSEDGYTRMNRKKSSQDVNLRDTDNAIARYDEILAIVLGKKPKTEYYTEKNGKVIKDTIAIPKTVNKDGKTIVIGGGDDWLLKDHHKKDTTPTDDDFKRTVANYLSWKVSNLMKG